MTKRYTYKQIAPDCWRIIDRWGEDDYVSTRFPRSESEAKEFCDFYNKTWQRRESDTDIARDVLTPDEFEKWLLSGGGE